ncbi:hypothetical protein SmJEL517_g02471 [Synchytrium microbalum]|uniref:16S rRNA (Cytosine(1402)-N(4))-methyltransferase n=1 Tax=Synchytrium microbalum TaxID=1806994 RepID=A0A507CC27_9FUNG|nr:uncharacterized protein SmJEL517_g02471 [Synchytrium microbalum]TPX35103.1 hypothetical protein SmJEL517_g02471 [Synchytrium microbalum]
MLFARGCIKSRTLSTRVLIHQSLSPKFSRRSLHTPVLIHETLSFVRPESKLILDATFGGGGTTKAVLACKVIAVDRDLEAFARANSLAKLYPQRIVPIHGNFSEMGRLLQPTFPQVDTVILDIGVSSFQLDQAERGFSFKDDSLLDMRMNTSEGFTAEYVVNEFNESELTGILQNYGEERFAAKIARSIVAKRAVTSIRTTGQLAEIVAKAIGRHEAKHPATRTFQGLRIYINDELNELKKGLEEAESLLQQGGRIIVITFHSLEDRIVKEFLKSRQAAGSLITLTKKVVKPTREEILANKRSRSGKLRAAEKALI